MFNKISQHNSSKEFLGERFCTIFTLSKIVLLNVTWYFQIYNLPEFNLVYSVRNFSAAPRVLVDSGPIHTHRCVVYG